MSAKKKAKRIVTRKKKRNCPRARRKNVKLWKRGNFKYVRIDQISMLLYRGRALYLRVGNAFRFLTFDKIETKRRRRR